MKRFLLFAGDDHYPIGGMNDFAGDFDYLDEAMEVPYQGDWAHVFDSHDGLIRAEKTTGEDWQIVSKAVRKD